MQKILIGIGILIFILTTIFVLSVDTSSSRKKVQFTNQNFIINNENANVENEDVKLSLSKSKISNKNIQASNKSLDVNQTDINLNNTDISTQDVDFDNTSVNTQDTEFEYDEPSYSNSDSSLNNQISEYESQKSRIRAIEKSIAAQRNNTSQQELPERRRYIYRDIDWNTWKSEFINKILDDSMEIKSLDDYGIGSWFYYSFTVTSTGEILNVNVTSMYLSKEDKEKVKQMIRNYAHQDITVFPANTRKTRAKVDAIMMLGDTEKKSKPADFNENEKVRILLPN